VSLLTIPLKAQPEIAVNSKMRQIFPRHYAKENRRFLGNSIKEPFLADVFGGNLTS